MRSVCIIQISNDNGCSEDIWRSDRNIYSELALPRASPVGNVLF